MLISPAHLVDALNSRNPGFGQFVAGADVTTLSSTSTHWVRIALAPAQANARTGGQKWVRESIACDL